MEPTIKVRERAARYRQIAHNIFDAKIAGEIEKIAEDYELCAGGDQAAAAFAAQHR
jgi:hypothetical protein